MSSSSAILKYLAECYRENGSRVGITSIESSRVRQHIFVEGEDLIVSDSVLDGQHFIPGKKAANLANQARLYEKDRELFYGAVFLIGNLEKDDSRRKPAFAPLILYPVAVEKVMEESGAEFAVDTSRRILNYALLENLGDDEFIRKVEAAVDVSGHSEGCVGELRRLFTTEFTDCATDELLKYPYLLKSRELRSVLTSVEDGNSNGMHLVPGAVLFLADKSTEMRGVLNDLELMANDSGKISAPVGALLGKSGSDVMPVYQASEGSIPAFLSEAQNKITASARENALTLAVGPPGTGKSFTIAALAIEAMSRGESVLIASKMDHAVDVVADKIESALGLPGVCVRGGRKSYFNDLKQFLEDLLSGLHTREEIKPARVKEGRKRLEKRAGAIAKAEEELERQLNREEKYGSLLSDPDPGWFSRWRINRIRGKAPDRESVAALASRVTKLMDEQVEETVSFLKLTRSFYLQEALTKHRPTFQAFSKWIRARAAHKKEEYLENVQWKPLLNALPIWLVNLSDLHRVIPPEKGLFSMVIIDEASQCDIASAMPALHRGCRAVITGDPRQLRHVSFLSVARQKEFARQFGVDEDDCEKYHFRSVSLIDLVSDAIKDQSAVTFLDEHFRSRPEIIRFSNREFYSDRLSIMTGHRPIDRHGARPLSLCHVEGKRSSSGVNEEEIERLVTEVAEIAEKEGAPLSIGILSPFRAQVDAIIKRFEKMENLNFLLERHDLLIGTAHSFQGEERDIMLLSFALDDESPSASFRYLEKQDVFNVSITRARLENRVFISFDRTSRPGPLVSRYLEFAETGVEAGKAEKPTAEMPSGKIYDVRAAIQSLGCEAVRGFSVGSYPVDLLCLKDGKSVGVDLVGFPGHGFEAISLQQHLMLRRAGIRLFPLSLVEWETKKDKVLRELENWLK